ncbi:MAG: hypothetical protein NUV46_01515 [Nanoarchaeota archaeon]|nr:hypothetical protein [Nanoarchaeota archaeon]
MIGDYLVGGVIILINLIAIFTRKGRYIPLTITISLLLALVYMFLQF